MTRDSLLADAVEESARARKLFPSPDHLTLALAEEAGEVVKAALDFRQGKATRHDLRKELKQTIAMCLRLAEEGDPTIGVPALLDAEPRPTEEPAPAPRCHFCLGTGLAQNVAPGVLKDQPCPLCASPRPEDRRRDGSK